jgi:hypothetical protein
VEIPFPLPDGGDVQGSDQLFSIRISAQDHEGEQGQEELERSRSTATMKHVVSDRPLSMLIVARPLLFSTLHTFCFAYVSPIQITALSPKK